MNRGPDRKPWNSPHPIGTEVRVFKLSEELTKGGSAAAKYRHYNVQSGQWETDEVSRMTVHDACNDFEGDIGTNGIAVRIGRLWVVIQLMCAPEE